MKLNAMWKQLKEIAHDMGSLSGPARREREEERMEMKDMTGQATKKYIRFMLNRARYICRPSVITSI